MLKHYLQQKEVKVDLEAQESSMRKNLGAFLALSSLAAMSSEDMQRMREYEEREKQIERERIANKIALPRQIIPHVPKGTKEYFFNNDGEFSTKSMLKTECVFKCVASNDKNAKRKFVKWKATKIINS